MVTAPPSARGGSSLFCGVTLVITIHRPLSDRLPHFLVVFFPPHEFFFFSSATSTFLRLLRLRLSSSSTFACSASRSASSPPSLRSPRKRLLHSVFARLSSSPSVCLLRPLASLSLRPKEQKPKKRDILAPWSPAVRLPAGSPWACEAPDNARYLFLLSFLFVKTGSSSLVSN